MTWLGRTDPACSSVRRSGRVPLTAGATALIDTTIDASRRHSRHSAHGDAASRGPPSAAPDGRMCLGVDASAGLRVGSQPELDHADAEAFDLQNLREAEEERDQRVAAEIDDVEDRWAWVGAHEYLELS